LSDKRSEKVLNKLIGGSDVKDALLQLDSLTKEESLMAVARNLEVMHHVDDNVKELKVLAEDNVQVIDRVDQNVKEAKERTP
jgi:hypothetical protein